MDIFVGEMSFLKDQGVWGKDDTRTYSIQNIREVRQDIWPERMPLYQPWVTRAPRTQAFATFYIRRDGKKYSVESSAGDLFTVFSLVGGFVSLSTLLVGYFVYTFSSKFYLISLMRKLYHVENLPEITKLREGEVPLIKKRCFLCLDVAKYCSVRRKCCMKQAEEWDNQVEETKMSRSLFTHVERRREHFIR